MEEGEAKVNKKDGEKKLRGGGFGPPQKLAWRPPPRAWLVSRGLVNVIGKRNLMHFI